MNRGRSAPRVAVIGWGSLIWDPDGFEAVVNRDESGAIAWRAVGPTLPLEFSRVSRKRPGALTLVVDPEHGAPCRTLVADAAPPAELDAVDAVAWAAERLAARERAPLSKIGRVGPSGPVAERGGDAVARWLTAAGYRGAVWTDLEPTFQEATGARFSVAAGLAHLRALPDAERDAAVDYVLRAPPTTATPLRAALESAESWAEIVRRRRSIWARSAQDH